MLRPQPRLLLAHYMPWYVSKPASGVWGWHWTMNHFDPEREREKRRPAASRYYPLVGLYDSGDLDALQYQVMLWKLAGIDGVVIDWFGSDEFLDYGVIHRNAQRLVSQIEKAGLRFSICYENQVIRNQVNAGKLAMGDTVARGQAHMRWLDKNFFASPAYVRLDGRPLLFSFGEPYFNDTQMNTVFSVCSTRPLHVMENDRRLSKASDGAFVWPVPNNGTERAIREMDGVYARKKDWPAFVGGAFPRFQDMYARAGVGKSYGSIEDREGRTYRETLTKAMASGAPVVQLVTWNDWGEGTQIEPSVEFGYRDLETTQQLRKSVWGEPSRFTAADLRLPVKWYELRKKNAADPAASRALFVVFPLVVAGNVDKARAVLGRYGG